MGTVSQLKIRRVAQNIYQIDIPHGSFSAEELLELYDYILLNYQQIFTDKSQENCTQIVGNGVTNDTEKSAKDQ